MSAQAGYLELIVDSTSVAKGDAALQKIAATGAKTEAAVTKSTAAMSKGMASVGAASGVSANSVRAVTMQLSQVAQQGAVTGNYMQALGIQIADIAAVMGVGGLAGVALMLGGALVPVAMSMIGVGDAGKALKGAMDDLTDSVDDYRRASSEASESSVKLFDKFGRFAGAARETLVVLRDLAQLDALSKLQASMDAISEMSVAEDISDFAESFELSGKNAVYALDKLRERFGLSGQGAIWLAEKIRAIGDADGPDAAAAATAELNRFLKEVYGSTQKIPDELRELARQAANGNLAAQTLLATMSGVTDETRNAASAASSLASRLGAAAASGAADAKRQLAVVNAQIAAVNAGADEAAAAKKTALDLDRQAYRQAQLAAGKSEVSVRAAERWLFADRERLIVAEQQLSAAQKTRAEAERAAKRGAKAGGAAAAKGESDMLREAQQWYEKTRTSAEKYADTVARLNELKAAGAISDDTYARAIKQTKKELDGVEDSTKAGVDATMTLIDAMTGGFKNAREAVAQLLMQVAKMQLYKGLMGMSGGGGFFGWLGGLLTSANGNVISGGQHVKAYANGGVVTGPTLFPMKTGAGLMGEAGPEAIMPLTRTADGKLGVRSANANSEPRQMQVHVVPSPYFDVRVAEVSSYGDAQTAKLSQRAMPGAINDMQARGTR